MMKTFLESEEVFKTIFMQAPLGIAMVDSLTGHIYAVNPRFAKIAGRTVEEMEHINWMQITHPDDVQGDLDNMALLIAGKIKEFQMEKRYIHPDGKEVWIYMSIVPLKVEDSTQLRHLCMIEDISERKQVEEKMNTFSQAIKQSPVSIVITDTKGNIEYVNSKFIEITGYTFEEAIGKNPRILKSGHTSDEEYKNLWDTITAGEEWRGELYNRKKDGTLYCESAMISPIKNAKDEITHFLAVKEDMTGTKQAEMRFTDLFNLSPQPMWLYDLQTLKFIQVNQATIENYGYSEEELLNMTVLDIRPEAEILTTKEFIEKHRRELDRKQTANFVHRRKSGETFDVEIFSTTILSNEQRVGTVIAIDVTEKKRVEKELLAAKERAEESDKLKSAFLQNISHEVRTPLNAIVGFSQLMTMPDQPVEKLKTFSEMISESSQKLIKIMTDLIEISQIQANTIKPVFSEINIAGLLKELVKEYSNIAHGKNLNLSLNAGSSEFLISSDSSKLKRIFSHLIDNAIKFTSRGSVNVDLEITSTVAKVSVSDTGIGITDKMQQLIFNPFRQAEIGNERNFGGNGLGLSIVKAYTELLNGSIQLNSKIGKGTTVTIMIPLNKYEQNVPVEIFSAKPENRILIVEDEYSNYLYLAELLKEFNSEIFYASNGKEAVDFCRGQQKIDIIFMDLSMPVMDGLEAAALIKEFRKEIPIIAQTAHVKQFGIDQFTGIFDDYITKPFNKNDLKKVMIKYIK
jgi:PAS domain S-box-containing protein